jgi:hypothetical protein
MTNILMGPGGERSILAEQQKIFARIHELRAQHATLMEQNTVTLDQIREIQDEIDLLFRKIKELSG